MGKRNLNDRNRLRDMKKKIYLLALFVFLLVSAQAQRTWFEFEVSKKLTEKLEFSLAPEVRFKEQFELNEYFLEPGLEYKFNKYFSLGAKYRFGNNLKKNGDSDWFGRYAFDAKTGYDWKHLGTQLRLRYTNSDDFEDAEENYLRLKLKLDYAIKKLDLTPYAAYEIYRDVDNNEFSKAHWEGGLKYKINKHHKVGAYFRLNDYLNDDETVKIIGFTYAVKL